MKRLIQLKRKKGFSLTECLIAMGVFAIMASMVMQILAIAIMKNKQNYRVDKDMDVQIQAIVNDYNSLLDRGTVNLAMSFIKTDGASSVGDMNINDVKVQMSNGSSIDDGLQINTMTADIDSAGEEDDESEGGGMITDKIHLYGTKGITKIYIDSTALDKDEDTKSVTFTFTITDSDDILRGDKSSSIKISLPKSATNVTANCNNQGLTYLRLSDTNIRFYSQSYTDTRTAKAYSDMTITFDIPADKFDTEFGTFDKYFVDSKSESATVNGSATFCDSTTPGIYNTKL